MRLVIQRVTHASVTVAGKIVGQCGMGFCILAGVKIGDTQAEAKWLANKVANLRVFEDDAGKMNRSLLDVKGDVCSRVRALSSRSRRVGGTYV